MSVRMVIGRSGSGKTSMFLDEIRDRLTREPEGTPIIYIVPEQMTFLSEYRLATDASIGGMIRAQVYSFSRLAWRILQETGGISRTHLSSVGLNMLIRKILDEQKENLKIFQRAADKNGFVQQLEQIITEFKRYCLRPEELIEKSVQFGLGDTSVSKALHDKLNDLELIYSKFEDEIFGKYIDSEDYFRLLAEKISASAYLKEAEIYIDGFYSFTPQEYLVMAELMKHCKRVSIAVTADRLFVHSEPDELDLFRASGETCYNIYDLARISSSEIEQPIILKEQVKWNLPSLRHLEKEFDTRPAAVFKGAPAIHISQAVNRRAEIEGIAWEIRDVVRTSGYRYREIALLIRNGGDYHEIVEPVFDDYQIPYFIDQKRTMLNHPLIELIRSSLEVINSYWRYEPVFRAIKTELLYPPQENPAKMREKMDRLENYCLAYGINGGKWTKKERWVYRRIRGLESAGNVQTDAEKELEQELNELKLMVTAPILRLSRRLKKADTGRKLCEAIYLYLEELDIPDKLEKWKMAAEEKGNLLRMREHEQVWNAVVDLLDQYVEILGEEQVTPKAFAAILEAGFESLHFSLIPPALDQVLIGDLEKSRLNDIKIVFMVGVNEGVLPAKISDDGILADEDRELLLTAGMKVAPSSRTRLLDETFLAYKAFTAPSEKLYVSYPLANDEGKALIPSSYIKRLKDMFPDAKEEYLVTDPAELEETEQLRFVSNYTTTMSYLNTQLQWKKRNYPISSLWWDVYNFYLESSWKNRAQKVFSSLYYSNSSVQLSKEVADELYGETIQASVSRMELFNGCAFSHFAQHGLKLRERQIFRLEAPDIGELFHAALKQIADIVNDQNMSWAELTRKQCEDLSKEAVKTLAPKLQNEILLSSERHHYIKRKLEQIITRASIVLSEHAKVSGFSPIGLELGFGPNGDLPPLTFSLKNGKRMELAGRIDRVDKANLEDDSVFLRVIDYKSSEKDVNLTEVYYGLALQMLTYLDIVITHSNELVEMKASPAGVLYFHVHNPFINTTKMLSMDEIENEMMKKFKMNGLMVSDQRVIQLMDQTLESGDSQIVAAGIKKDGNLSKKSKVASLQEFDHLRNHVRDLYQKTGNAITNGQIDIAPYKLKDKTPCTFCSYKAVCQFDESIESNRYRILTPHSKEDVLELIKKESTENE
ncbi:helicase-exonuclease AddAB subunit AddB [Neobacillus sp. MM2021_6]|uniref:helicase-exonuclease AddAB subunit AddB n=1 Tax=Bacillaceae TaxID=186817 RepID=UPI001409ADE8|nr:MULTISPECIES: helicase-exonuclease AddAB subunit AddB [Bacillaceae]MBO0961255.1 helicase-exonuclease AddAB subunit AddB [Neobacillus sp. MM2021_6]NHC18746.1 helicase-exonuclease AddAB subunit AddB [Bacillus sp. MM2020_4]